MSRLTDRQLARKLRPDTTPEPPAGLLDELRRQIPAEVKAPAPPPDGNLLPFRRPLPRRVWLAAASVAMLLGGGTLSWLALRHHVGLEEAAAPTLARQEADDYQSPAETRDGSAEAMQPRDRRALGYAGAPPSVQSAPAPAYPGRFGNERQVAADAEAANGALPVQPAEVPRALPAPAVAASVEDVMTVTAESPLVGERRIAAGTTVSREELEKVPTARDPWRILRSTPGVLADRVGGNETGAAKARGRRGDAVASAEAPARAAAQAAVAAPRAAAPATAAAPEPLAPSASAAGGAAEAVEETPHGELSFESSGANPFVDSEEDRLSTFALDAGSGSYDVVRRALAGDRLPPAEAVRVGELLDAFDYGDAPPAAGDFALRAEGAPDPWAPGGRYVLVRFAVTARQGRGPGGSPQVVAAEARTEVEVDPRFVARWRLLGAEERDAAGDRGRDDSLDSGAVRAGHGVSVLYELELRPETPANATLAMLRLRWRAEQGGAIREMQRPFRRGDVAPRWESASRAFRLAAVVGRFAEVLHGSYWARGGQGDELAELARRVAAVGADWPREPRVQELARLIARARDLRRLSGDERPQRDR